MAALLLGAGLCLPAPSPTFAQDRISLEDARTYAVGLLQQGQPRAARDVVLALLSGAPTDSYALILLSQSELALGNTAEARRAGRAAWANATDDDLRFGAATVTAQAFAAEDKMTRAQIWLRRASEYATTGQSRAITAQLYQQARQANPLAVQLSFGLTPSNNVNGGNSNQTITFAYLPGPFASIAWAVPEDEKPLSGLEVSGDVALRYRLHETANSRLWLDSGISMRGYIMSAEARATAPAVTGESLSFGQASLGLSYHWRPESGSASYSAQVQGTHSVYAMEAYSNALSASLGGKWALGENDSVSVTALARHTTYLANDDTATTYEIRGDWDHRLANEDRITTSVNLGQTRADASDRAYTGISASLAYDFGEITENFDLSVLYQEEFRTYETSNYDPAGREDRQTVLQLRAGFPSVQFYGFEPVATLTARRTNSSVPYFDTEGVQMGVSLRSRF